MRKVIRLLMLPLWAASLCAIVSTLMASHWATLPHPETGSQLPTESETVGEDLNEDNGRIRLTYHFLYSGCRCSQRVIEHLLKRGPIENASEQIVLVGSDAELESRILNARYRLVVISEAELKERYDVEAAPLMVIADMQGKIRYSGGYSSRKQSLDYQDVAIIAKAIKGDEVEGLPVYGCAVSTRLQKIVDPLGIKY